VTVLAVNVVKNIYLPSWFARIPWWEGILVLPVTAILPLLPLTFPVVWRLVSTWGVTKLQGILQDITPAQVPTHNTYLTIF